MRRQKFILIILILISLISLLGAYLDFQTSQNSSSQTLGTKIDKPLPIPSNSPSLTQQVKSPTKQITTKSSPKPSLSPSPTPIATSNPNPTPTHTPTPNSTPEQFLIKVNLSINGDSFTISIPENSNQCDVLSRALEQGKITSLNMRYDKSLETYAVYQINGLGKENSVWWVYTVNGQSPSRGCSYIKVSNEDNIEWKYIGS